MNSKGAIIAAEAGIKLFKRSKEEL